MSLLRAVAALLLAAAAASPAVAASLVLRSSATLDSGGSDVASAVTVDSVDNIILVGSAGSDAVIAKYGRDLSLISSGTFNGGGSSAANAVAVGPGGKIAVAVSAANHYAVVLYDSNLNFLSSATLSVGVQDVPRAIAMDGTGGVYVTGYTFDGAQFRFLTARYSAGLGLLASDVYSAGAQDFAHGLALDASNNVYVAGQTLGAGWDFLTLRYDAALSAVTASAVFDNAGNFDMARSVVVTPAGRVVVAGQSSPDDVTYSQAVVEYNAGLTFVSSGSYSSGDDDRTNAAALDAQGDVYVTGQTSPAGVSRVSVTKFSPALVVLGTNSFTGGISDIGRGVVVDSKGNPILAGESDDGVTLNLLALRYNGPPLLTAAGQGLQGAAGQTVTLTGDNFVAGTVPTFTDIGITVNGAGPSGSTQLVMNLDIAASVTLGRYGVTVTNPDGSSASANALFDVVHTIAVTASQTFSESALGAGGPITLSGAANIFTQNVLLTLAKPAAVPAPGAFLASGVVVDVSANVPGTLSQTYTASLSYANANIGALDPALLVVAYYDVPTATWIQLASAVDSVGKTVTTTAGRLAVLQIMQPGGGGGGGDGGGGGSGIPATARHEVFAGPNPYKPGGGNFSDPVLGRGIVFYNLPATFRLEIYDVNGTRVFRHSGASSGGKYLWDTGTDGGTAGSGIYLFRAFRPDGGLINRGKFAIVR